MFCSNCGSKIPSNGQFCSSCGARVGELNVVSSNNVNFAGRDSINAGRDVYIASSEDSAQAEYEIRSRRTLPVGKKGLAGVAAVFGIFGALATLGQLVLQIAAFDSPGERFEVGVSVWWLSGGMLALVVAVVALGARRLLARRAAKFPPWPSLPVLSGWGGELQILRLNGKCPSCGGRLRFYEKPIEWVQDLHSSRRKVTKRAPSAECSRNENHWWVVDVTSDDAI